ncbi:hypothetical protein NEIELOOT_00767 [Neisseria elongata subsp. glycolytica ATCC 29315]|uniref:Uncharacterized protein n=1 Tax=Neisseria elongata subsp. glycolytica ATCC 29315 TaxID=546263 RepID=D4DNY2_NEIEG|nr:hypothetical protein NEIELOOT_00767 [Neisseria elongata subsp. glycolytica ATCC 29315]
MFGQAAHYFTNRYSGTICLIICPCPFFHTENDNVSAHPPHPSQNCRPFRALG